MKIYTFIRRFESNALLSFSLYGFQTFNATDTVLQSVTTWPDIVWVDFFETKLKFQIQHSIFRTKVRIVPNKLTRVEFLNLTIPPYEIADATAHGIPPKVQALTLDVLGQRC